MANQDEINEIVRKGKNDGVKLINVSATIYTVLIVFNWILGVGGGIGSFVLMSKEGFGPGIALGIGVVVICSIIYAGAVLSTHVAKVLVHLLFANLANLEKGQA